MARRTKKAVLLAKTETTSGTDAAPDGTNPMLLFDSGSFCKLDTRLIETISNSDSFTEDKDGIGRQIWNWTPKTKFMPRATTASGAPWLDPLLKACGMVLSSGGSVGASSSWIYKPRSASFQTCTMWEYADGMLTKSPGCRGTFAITFEAGSIPEIAFTMQGLYSEDPSDASAPSLTKPVDTKISWKSAAATIGAFASTGGNNGLILRRAVVTLGWEIVELPDANASNAVFGFDFNRRRSMLDLTIQAMDSIAAKNFYTYLNSTQVGAADGSMDDITFSLGTATSKVVTTYRAPQLKNVEQTEENGIYVFNLPYKSRNSTADNDLEIKYQVET